MSLSPAARPATSQMLPEAQVSSALSQHLLGLVPKSYRAGGFWCDGSVVGSAPVCHCQVMVCALGVTCFGHLIDQVVFAVSNKAERSVLGSLSVGVH